VKKDGKIILYCKGADSKIKERLDSSEKEIMEQTDEHLNVRNEIFLIRIFIILIFLIEICQ
jgi:magnesium-transporting ATPase (P-type)